MIAVAEKPKATAKRATRKTDPAVQSQKPQPPIQRAAQAPTIEEERALFREIALDLDTAALTDEDHAHSGDSDRLLNIAAMIASNAAKGILWNNNHENAGYDIAACINAARLVPGDTESLERTAAINQAGVKLGVITETRPDMLLFTHIPRPSPVQAPLHTTEPAASAQQFTQDQLNELHWRSYVNMDCARSVIFHYAEHANSEEVFALRDLLDMYCEATDEAMKAKETGNLSSGPLPDLSADLSKILHLFYIVNDDNRDDGVLHGVEYLLQAAKRIADGDLGVLE
ncbi:hypothetical protein HNP33_002037 [Comamonas odontotermitis]|uniref:Uncharacterized protein n=1 Tax=Comamonas odontotermitis TaxID=379895 RepID=A0ABR6RFN0_9BURK|nr:hypothetical protein [Comamonas odontotermitis]MBB6577969.1 hypothetical protein [Comamonas odontotermitis]